MKTIERNLTRLYIGDIGNLEINVKPGTLLSSEVSGLARQRKLTRTAITTFGL